MAQTFYNNVAGLLSGTHSAVTTSLTLQAGHTFPDPGTDYYLATLILLDSSARETAWEIVRVTDVAGNVLTVVRAQEGTTAREWAGNSRIEVRLTAGSLPWSQLGLRNKVINGGFAINQRGYVSGAATTTGQYTLDRWKVTGAGGVTYATSSNKTTVTIPTGQALQQVIEGLNLQTGTYCLSWEGTAQGKIGAGSLSASGVTGSITGGTDTTIEFGPGTVANVQLEFGYTDTLFEQNPIGRELELCQRYYYRLNGAVSTAITTAYSKVTNNSITAFVPFPVRMRTAPTTVETSGTGGHYGVQFGNTSTICYSAPTFNTATDYACSLGVVALSGHSAGQGGFLYAINASAFLAWSAEL